MKNFIQLGETLTVAAPATITSGQLVVVGSLIGVANFDAASGADVEIDIAGVFELPKVLTDAIAVGDRLYWDSAAAKLTKNQGTGSKPLVGYAVVAAANPSSTVRCNVVPTMALGSA